MLVLNESIDYRQIDSKHLLTKNDLVIARAPPIAPQVSEPDYNSAQTLLPHSGDEISNTKIRVLQEQLHANAIDAAKQISALKTRIFELEMGSYYKSHEG